MGQQQLLLVILVTIIVGIATVVAINTFGAAADDANVQASIQDSAQIGATAQSFYMRPEMLGGGGRDFSDITWDDIPMGFDDDCAHIEGNPERCNENAGFTTITSPGSNDFTFTTIPAQAGGVIAVRVCADDVQMSSWDADGTLGPSDAPDCDNGDEGGEGG